MTNSNVWQCNYRYIYILSPASLVQLHTNPGEPLYVISEGASPGNRLGRQSGRSKMALGIHQQ